MADDIEDALLAHGQADAGLGALLGGTGTGMRLFWDHVPEATTLPYVYCTRTARPPHRRLSGRAPHEESAWTFTVVAETKASRRAVRKALEAAYVDTYGDVQGIQVYGILFDGGSDDITREADGSDKVRYEADVDLLVFHERI